MLSNLSDRLAFTHGRHLVGESRDIAGELVKEGFKPFNQIANHLLYNLVDGPIHGIKPTHDLIFACVKAVLNYLGIKVSRPRFLIQIKIDI